jgi:hypothetical protein
VKETHFPPSPVIRNMLKTTLLYYALSDNQEEKTSWPAFEHFPPNTSSQPLVRWIVDILTLPAVNTDCCELPGDTKLLC